MPSSNQSDDTRSAVQSFPTVTPSGFSVFRSSRCRVCPCVSPAAVSSPRCVKPRSFLACLTLAAKPPLFL